MHSGGHEGRQAGFISVVRGSGHGLDQALVVVFVCGRATEHTTINPVGGARVNAEVDRVAGPMAGETVAGRKRGKRDASAMPASAKRDWAAAWAAALLPSAR